MSQKVLLSSSSFNLARIHTKENNFAFIVGGHEYPCHSFFADFISPKVAALHLTDPLVSTFTIECNDDKHQFNLIMDIMYGKKVKVNQEQKDYIIKIAKRLGNGELYDTFKPFNPDEEDPDFEELFDIILTKYKAGMDIQREADIIAKNMHNVPRQLIRCVDLNLLNKIINSPYLVVDSEEELYNIIADLCKKCGPQYFSLFNNVIFENLDGTVLTKFVKEFKDMDVSGSLWSKVCNRLLLQVPDMHDYSRYKKRIDTLLKVPTETLKGIFKFLREICNGNPTNSLVSLTALKEHGSSRCTDLFTGDKSVSWGLTEREDNYLLFDFKNAKVRLTGYEIRSSTNSHWDNQQSWVIEAGNDKENWTILDTKVKNTEMGGNEKIHYWEIPVKAEPYRYIRWRLTQNGPGGLYCKAFELYGDYIRAASDL